MPEFAAGEQKTAVVPMTNPTAKAFDYVAQLYMGTDLAIMSEVSFHLEAGESKDINMPVTMPTEAGVYPVNIGVFSDGQFIEPVYHAEDVVITPMPITFTDISVSDVIKVPWMGYVGEKVGALFTVTSDAKYGGYDGVVQGNATIFLKLYLEDPSGNLVLVSQVSATPPYRETDPLGPYYFVEGSQSLGIEMVISTNLIYLGFPAGNYRYVLELTAWVGEVLGTGRGEGTLYYPG